MSATAAYDRTADRDALQQQMDEFARNGGMIEKLDYAGNLVGLEADQPKVARPVAKVLPFPAPTAKPSAPLAATPEKAQFAPTGKGDITKALRTLRADAERALAHLNAVFPGCGK